MALDRSVTLRDVAWRDLCPWLIILRTFRLAFRVRVLLLAVAALIAITAGWRLIGGGIFGGGEVSTRLHAWIATQGVWPWDMGDPDVVPPEVLDPPVAVPPIAGGVGLVPRVQGIPYLADGLVSGPLLAVWEHLSGPFLYLFDPALTGGELAYLLLCCGWALIVWAVFGGAITRIAALTLTRDEPIGIFGALRHASAKWPSYFSAPLMPLLGSLLILIPLWIVGLLMRVDILLDLMGLLWPVMLLAGLFLAILLIGLAVGWPLMWATISVEGSDAWDAISRAFAYTFERPLHLLFYVWLGSLLGIVGILVFELFADATYYLSVLATSWGMGDDRIGTLASTGNPESAGFGWWLIVDFWRGCLDMLKSAFQVGFFWANATAIYLLLRRSADATEMDEIALPDRQSMYEPPTLATGASGMPSPADETPPPESGELPPRE